MTEVVIQPIANGEGDFFDARVSVYLIDEDGTRRIGWNVSTLEAVTEHRNVDLGSASLSLELLPQDSIAIDAAGSQTYYRVRLATSERTEEWTITVPDSATPEQLADLVGAATIPAGSLLSGRLLPTGANANDIAQYDGNVWNPIPLPSGLGDVIGPASAVDQRIAIFDGTTGKLLADGGSTIADLGGHDAVTLAGALDYITLAAQELTLGPIDLATDTTGLLSWSAIGGTPTTLVGYGITDAASDTHNHAGIYEPVDATILRQSDVDDTPVNGAVTAPVSSNWAFDHAAGADPHPGYLLEANAGTAAVEDVGTAIGDVVQLVNVGGSAGLPAVDGSQLIGLPSGVSDHGALTGLADDDHTQYHNDTRGDARYSLLSHNHAGVYEPVDATILRQADVDDTPVNGAVTVPISSNWAFDHVAASNPHTQYLQDAPSDGSTYGRNNGAWTVVGGGGVTNLSNTPSSTEVTIESDTGTDTSVAAATAVLAGVMAAADKSKLDGIEASATADQTGAEIEGLLDTELANTDWKKPVGATTGTVCAGDDARLSDARTPTNHASTHAAGGSDTIKLDDLAAPDDNTDLNASTSAHGLAPKLSGDSAQYLDGTGSFSTPSVGAAQSIAKTVFNQTGSTLIKGKAVYINGWKTGNEVPTVDLARADSATTMPALGLVAADIANNSEGSVLILGPLTAMNTSGYALDDALYIDAGTAGDLTTTKPVGANLIQAVARVTRVHATSGTLFVAGALRSNDIPNFTAADKFWYGGTAGVSTEGAVTAFGRSLIDDADAASARTTLDVDQAGTDNSPAIGQYDIAARLLSGSGAFAGVAAADLTEEATPASGDWLLGWESGGAMRKFDVGDLPSGGGGGLTRTTQSITTTNFTASTGNHYLLTISGLTADRDFILPSGASDGDEVSWELVTDAPAASELVLKGASGAPVTLRNEDVAAETEVTRYFITGESGRAVWDGSASRWRISRGDDGRIAQFGQMYVSTAATTNTANAWTTVQAESGAWTARSGEVGDVCDATNGRFNVRRAGNYSVRYQGSPNGTVTSAYRWDLAVYDDTPTVIAQKNRLNANTSSNELNLAVFTISFNAPDQIRAYFRAQEANKGFATSVTTSWIDMKEEL